MIILQLLKSKAGILINKRLARNIGLEAAIMYAELLNKWDYFYGNDMLDNEGCFYHTIEDMEHETCLTGYQQRNAVKKLTELNLIESKVKGVPAKRFFKVNLDEGAIRAVLEQDVKILTTDLSNQNFNSQESNISQQAVKKPPSINTKENNKENTKNALPYGKGADAHQTTLFSLPAPEAKPKSNSHADLADFKIRQAMMNDDWSAVTDRDFTHYYIQRHNEVFPEKPVTFDRFSSVSIVRDNLIKAFDIEKSKVCLYINEILAIHKGTPDVHQNKYNALTFAMIQKHRPLMSDLIRQAELTLRPAERKFAVNTFTQIKRASEGTPEVF